VLEGGNGLGIFLRRQLAHLAGAGAAQLFAAHRAGRKGDLRIAADALNLARGSLRGAVDFAIFHGKPYGCDDGLAILAEGGQVDELAPFQRLGRGFFLV